MINDDCSSNVRTQMLMSCKIKAGLDNNILLFQYIAI
jgi:hypothetical protein